MDTILNEVRQAENILDSGEVGNKPTSTLFLLAKYFRQKKNLNKDDTIIQLSLFMEKNYKNYNAALWENILEDISKKALKYKMREIEYISITESEIKTINNLDKFVYRRLLFTMLCYAKMYNMMSENNNGWINAEIKEIYRMARVTVKHKEDKFLYLHDLWETGLIEFSKKNDNLNMRITFIDDQSETVLQVSDFRELGYEYMNYMGDGKFIRCQECGRLVKKKTNNQLYCLECKKKKQLEWDLNSKRRKRNELV